MLLLQRAVPLRDDAVAKPLLVERLAPVQPRTARFPPVDGARLLEVKNNEVMIAQRSMASVVEAEASADHDCFARLRISVDDAVDSTSLKPCGRSIQEKRGP